MSIPEIILMTIHAPEFLAGKMAECARTGCEKLFERRRRWHRFCSKECRELDHRSRRQKSDLAAVCPHCGLPVVFRILAAPGIISKEEVEP